MGDPQVKLYSTVKVTSVSFQWTIPMLVLLPL
jgi:hypothetical protein